MSSHSDWWIVEFPSRTFAAVEFQVGVFTVPVKIKARVECEITRMDGTPVDYDKEYISPNEINQMKLNGKKIYKGEKNE